MFEKILVATDFSDASKGAMRCARELAAKFGSTLHFINVVTDPLSLPWATEAFATPLDELVLQWQEQARLDLLAELPVETRSTAVIVTPVGSPYAEIIQYATDGHIDLIVMGTHGRGAVGHLVLGSVAERVVRKAPCAVLTIRQGVSQP
jgi:nucleotide-binding universal stress UspA family protein